MELNLDLVRREQYDLNIQPTHHINETFIEKATFGMGCYWAAESLFGSAPGVLRTRVGYSGGKLEFSDKAIGDHTEVIEISYNPEIISYENLLQIFWNNHEYDYTIKTQRKYMSLILYHTEEQKLIATKSKADEQIKRNPENITTEIAKVAVFYPSEDIQQKYKLQQHKDLFKSIQLNSKLLQTSYVATKLNGYIVGFGGLKQFLNEVHAFGLTPTQIEYIKFYVRENENGGMSC